MSRRLDPRSQLASSDPLIDLPESPYDNEPLESPEALERLKQRGEEIAKARIVSLRISETQAGRIVGKLWPNEPLLGATCGRGFLIDTAEQAAVVNEVLAPGVQISFHRAKHTWFIQTWPEVVDPA